MVASSSSFHTPIHQLYILNPSKLTFKIPDPRFLPIRSLGFFFFFLEALVLKLRLTFCFSALSYLPSILTGLALAREVMSWTAHFQATLSLPDPGSLPASREPLTTPQCAF